MALDPKQKKMLLYAVVVVVVLVLIYLAWKQWGPKEKFMPDIMNWPQVDSMEPADTYPYGNYAGNIDMYYPTLSPYSYGGPMPRASTGAKK